MPIKFGLEALKAQAVAARSYVLVQCKKNKDNDYDVVNTTDNQVYLTDEKLKENNNVFEIDRILIKSTFMVAASFLLSATLNFFLTKYIVVSPAGTAAFNEELGTLTALSYPAIALPSTAVMFLAIYYVFKKITS